MTKVLFAASEAVPFIKTGGLADVMGALPRYLKKSGVETALVIPKYSQIADRFKKRMEKVYEGTVDLSWRQCYLGVEKLTWEGLTVYFIDNEQYFKREGIYGYNDDAERFGYFSKAVLAMLPHIDFKPDIIHCNDWHTGMLNVFLKECFYHDEYYRHIKTVYTVHNLKYQGIYPGYVATDTLGLKEYLFNNGSIECDGCVNYMKAGLVYADYITTVSPSYAEEITQPYFGERLDGYIKTCGDHLQGILNGLDEEHYNPATDEFIAAQYDAATAEKGKARDKEDLQLLLGLPVNRKVPVIALISRLVEDKGIDLITRIMDEIVLEDVQFVVLGTGPQHYEEALRGLAARNPAKVSVNTQFNETLAHKIYAGADIFLMPSRFEACGLSQLIALKYGTVPIVREVGGLKDTVEAFDKTTKKGNGLSFTNFNAHDLLFTIKLALSYYENKVLWNALLQNAMHSDFGWSRSAELYKNIYTKLATAAAAEAKAEQEAVKAVMVKTKKPVVVKQPAPVVKVVKPVEKVVSPVAAPEPASEPAVKEPAAAVKKPAVKRGRPKGSTTKKTTAKTGTKKTAKKTTAKTAAKKTTAKTSTTKTVKKAATRKTKVKAAKE